MSRRCAVAGPVGTAAAAAPARGPAAPRLLRRPLTNLAHLDFLRRRTVTPPAQAGHTTYRLAQDPAVGVLWIYADRRDDGNFRPVGGGAYDPATGHYGAGRLQRRRHRPRGGGLPAALAADRRPRQPRPGLPAAARADATCRPRPGRTPATSCCGCSPTATLQPERRCRSELPDPSDSADVVLAGPHDLGARRGLRGLPRRRPGVRRASCRSRMDLAVARAGPARCSAATASTRSSTGVRVPGLADRRRRRRDAPRPCWA